MQQTAKPPNAMGLKLEVVQKDDGARAMQLSVAEDREINERIIKALESADPGADDVDVQTLQTLQCPTKKFSARALDRAFSDSDDIAEIRTFESVLAAIEAPVANSAVTVRYPPAALAAAYPYQKEGVERAVREMDGNLLLADHMGLGKTLQSLCVAHHFLTEPGRRSPKLLIVAPKSLQDNWVRECKKWLGDGFRVIKIATDAQPFSMNDYDAMVVTYGLAGVDARKKRKEIAALEWNVIIADESHALQNKDSQRTKALSPLLMRARSAILVTGTPALSRPEQLYSQMRIIFKSTAVGQMSWTKFTERYCNAHMNSLYRNVRFWDARGASRTYELHSLLDRRMIRRFQSVVLPFLPAKTRQVVELDVPAHELLPYTAAKREWEELNAKINDPKTSDREVKNLHYKMKPAWMKMFHATAAAKREVVCDYAIARAKVRKVIIFVHHEDTVKALERRAAAEGIGFVTITGSTKGSKRQPIIDKLLADDDIRLGILSITACCMGINVVPTVLETIMGEIYFVPSISLQAEARTHRLGCTDPVTITYIVARGTLDPALLAMNQKKFAVNDAVVDDGADRAGFSIAKRIRMAFDGAEFERFGMHMDARRIKVPMDSDKETIENYLKRAAVPVNRDDAADFFVDNDPSMYENNTYNNAADSMFRNLREWDYDAQPDVHVSEVIHFVLGDATLEQINAIKALPTSFQRACELRTATICGIFTCVTGAAVAQSAKRARMTEADDDE